MTKECWDGSYSSQCFLPTFRSTRDAEREQIASVFNPGSQKRTDPLRKEPSGLHAVDESNKLSIVTCRLLYLPPCSQLNSCILSATTDCQQKIHGLQASPETCWTAAELDSYRPHATVSFSTTRSLCNIARSTVQETLSLSIQRVPNDNVYGRHLNIRSRWPHIYSVLWAAKWKCAKQSIEGHYILDMS